MDKGLLNEPKLGDAISQDSPWAVVYCDQNRRITSYSAVGRFTEKEGLSAVLTTKHEINRIKALGYDPVGLKIDNGKILVRYGDKIRKRKLELLTTLKFKSRASRLLQNSLSLLKAISWNLAAMLSAAMIASGVIFALTPSEVIRLSGLGDYLSIFIPIFATSVAIISLFTSINESRRLASEERHHSVRPLIFVKFKEGIAPEDRVAQDKPNLISIYEEKPQIAGTLNLENHGLGLVTNLRFFLHDGKYRAAFSHSFELIRPGEQVSANAYFPGLWKGSIMTMYSVGENIYGAKVVTLHVFGIETTPEGDEIKIIFNRQLEPSFPAYKKILQEIY